MKKIRIFDRAGAFAENKDVARNIRLQEIIPNLEKKEEVILDFEKVEVATQSFIHALISDLLRHYGTGVLERVTFKSCDDTVKKLINIVVDYMQEGMDSDDDADVDDRP